MLLRLFASLSIILLCCGCMCCNWLQYRHNKITTCCIYQRCPFSRCPSVSTFNAHTFIYFVGWLCFFCRPLVCWLSYYVFTLYLSVYHFALFLRFHNTKAKTHKQRSKYCAVSMLCAVVTLSILSTLSVAHISKTSIVNATIYFATMQLNFQSPLIFLLKTLQIYNTFSYTQVFFRKKFLETS